MRRSIRARAAFTSRRFRRRSGGTTGSSWTARPGPRGASRSGTCSCRRPASTASPRAACWRTSTGRRSRSASSRAIRSTRGRAGGTARRAPPPSTRSPIPTGSCTRCGAPASGARGSGSGSSWDEALAGDRVADPRRDRRGPPERGHVPRRPARRGRVHRARARGLGRRRAQHPHERVQQRRARRLPLLDGRRPPEPRPRERAGDRCSSAATSRPATTSIPTRSASSRPSSAGRS